MIEKYGTLYLALRTMPNGEEAGVTGFMFTFALVVGVTEHTAYRTRYCYERPLDALVALATWDGTGDPPGPWIKQKPEERLGPGALAAQEVREREREWDSSMGDIKP